MDALRSVVQPITHNLPAPIRDLGVSLIGQACYKTLLLDVNLEDTDCLKLAVSKGLGVGIIAASSIVKVPQMIKLVQSRSSAGVSFLAYLLETSACLITLAYNVRNGFPFNTYGETAMLVTQNAIISVMILNYGGRASAAAVFVAALAGSVGLLFADGLLDMQALSYLQACAGVLGAASKVPQIATIWQEGTTGQLSAFTVRFPLPHLSLSSRAHKLRVCPYRIIADKRKKLRTGLQLRRRLAFPHLHHPARSGRQAHLVRLHRRLRLQRHPSRPDGVLLERALRKGQGQAQGHAYCRVSWLLICHTEEGPDHPTTRLELGCVKRVLFR
jgi:mannose-P-dolichol utilization defect protein 1